MSALVSSISPRRRRAFGLLVATEIKLAWRRPVGLAVGVGSPLVLLVIFGSIPTTTRPMAKLGGISFFNLYVPSLLVFVLIVVALMQLPQQLATYRQQGVLRRMSTTPVQPTWLLAAQVVVCVIFSVIGLALLLAVGGVAFGLALPHTLGGYLVSLASLGLTLASMVGLGLCCAAVARSPQAAHAITLLMFYPLAFFSGLYFPIQEIHSGVVTELSKVLPTGAGFNALHAAFTGQSPGAGPLLVLAGWAAGCSLVAARTFRWE